MSQRKVAEAMALLLPIHRKSLPLPPPPPIPPPPGSEAEAAAAAAEAEATATAEATAEAAADDEPPNEALAEDLESRPRDPEGEAAPEEDAVEE